MFVALNFSGNHTVMSDPGIALPTGWMPKGPGVEDNRATAAGRGTAAGLWPIEDIVERGYALATFYYGDVMPDRPDFTGGVYPFFRQGQGPQRGPTEWGAIAAWGWGLQRAVDYVLTDNAFDPRRIVAFGHSRNGKAALVAAAFDDRIAAVIPHQAGCGGSAPSRRKNPKGEPVQRINEVFPHWFDEIFHRFGGHEEQLPFDQHCLVAVCTRGPCCLPTASRINGPIRRASSTCWRPPRRCIDCWAARDCPTAPARRMVCSSAPS